MSSRAGGHTGFVHESDIHSPTLLPLSEFAQTCADVLKSPFWIHSPLFLSLSSRLNINLN